MVCEGIASTVDFVDAVETQQTRGPLCFTNIDKKLIYLAD